MALRIRVRTSSRPDAIKRGYRIRPGSFIYSVMLHGVLIAGVFMVPTYQYPAPKRPIYEELIQPEVHKIVWYNFPKPKPLPEVSAPKRIGTFPRPRGQERSDVAIIATAPKPKSVKQFIWQPVPKLEIHQDMPAPNLISRAAMAIPAPPPPPEPQPKIDKPDTPGVRAPQPNLSPPTPNGDVNKAQPEPTQPVEVPKPRKAFVPPPPVPQQSRLPIPVQTAEVPLPNVSITGTPTTRGILPEGLGAPAFSKGAPPPPNAPPGPVNSAGNGKVDVAVASLHPSDKPGPVPDGSRPGAFSKAPDVGEVATGEVTGSGLSIPNLTIQESKPVDPPHVNEGRKTILYADRVRTLSISTLSVPLRPSSRTIPAAIDARFQGRLVYTMVIPIENLPPYSGDWILWFAERQVKQGDAPFVRAPVPLRKFETVEPVLPGSRTELRVQMSVVINKDGKLERITLLRNLAAVLERAVIKDVSAWEFKPATRDGVPVDVDGVLEIPFSLPPQLAQGSPQIPK
jgi:hypothetical protein